MSPRIEPPQGVSKWPLRFPTRVLPALTPSIPSGRRRPTAALPCLLLISSERCSRKQKHTYTSGLTSHYTSLPSSSLVSLILVFLSFCLPLTSSTASHLPTCLSISFCFNHSAASPLPLYLSYLPFLILQFQPHFLSVSMSTSLHTPASSHSLRPVSYPPIHRSTHPPY